MSNSTHGINELYPPKEPGKYTVSEIRFLTESQESDFVEFLAYNGKIIGSELIHTDVKFDNESIFQKLFVNSDVDINTRFDRKKLDYGSPLFLKNKYLYLKTEGAQNYLEARYDMKSGKSELDKLEIKTLINLLDDKTDNLTLISLGSANCFKEIDTLVRVYCETNKHGDFTLIPIDVSTTLIQLAVLYFYKRFPINAKRTIKPIIGDFLDAQKKASEIFALANSDYPFIFTMLGSTLSNYREKSFLKDILSFMRTDDLLVLGFDIYDDGAKIDTEKERIYKQYHVVGTGNFDFMIGPLANTPIIPNVQKIQRDFGKKTIQEVLITQLTDTNDTNPFYKRLTDVPSSICYAPIIAVEHPTQKTQIDISLAQSTKYKYEEFVNFLKTEVCNESQDKSRKDYFEVCDGSEKGKLAACLVLRKKTEIDNTALLVSLSNKISNKIVALMQDSSITETNKKFLTDLSNIFNKNDEGKMQDCIKYLTDEYRNGQSESEDYYKQQLSKWI